MRQALLRIASAALVSASFAAAGGSVAAAGSGPVVVELYTSQGCHSCPPADAYLGKLAKRDGVIALSFHITYWDYLGWRDPFALPAATKRQRNYSRQFRRGYVYTPQMVIDGRAETVGSRTWSVDREIKKAKARDDKITVTFTKGADGSLQASLPAGPEGAAPERASVMMVLFDRAHTTRIKRGENAGKTLTYHNVVRAMRKIGTWDGKAQTIRVPWHTAGHDGRDGCVVLVQSQKTGRIIGAGLMPMRTASKARKN